MKIIGLTGGIGSGKTTVCKIFETLNVPVFYADAEGKRLMKEDERIKDQVLDLFGEEAYSDGHLNSAHIAKIVFSDEARLKQLNAIIHPAVHQSGLKWAANNSDRTYSIREVAILFESGAFRFVDKVITVWAPLDLRIDRVLKRDGVTKEQVEDRMSHQISDGLRLSMSDFVIRNDGSTPLIAQVQRIHEAIQSLP